MNCKRCKKSIPDDARYCPYGAADQQPPERKPKARGNGQGSVYKRGKTWTASFVRGYEITEINGKLKSKAIRATKSGFKTKKEALEHLQILKSANRPHRHDGITFKQLYEKWLERHSLRVTRDTLNCYKAAYKYYSDIHHMQFAELSTEDWQMCVDDCTQGKRTKQNMKALGTLLYGYAYELKVTHDNYAAHIYIPHMETESRKPFPLDVVKTILDAAKQGVPYADYVAVLCFTGYRPSELLQIEVSAFDEVNRMLRGGIKTDAGKNRIVTIPPIILPYVKEHAKVANPLLFPRAGGSGMDEKYFREECFYPLLERLGVQPMPDSENGIKPIYTPYSCRHTYATLLKKTEGSMKDKAALMGHTSYEMTLHYQHEDVESLRTITDSLWTA